ncbi:hypothetical protein GCM10010520_51280 [Rhizobium viscosum]
MIFMIDPVRGLSFVICGAGGVAGTADAVDDSAPIERKGKCVAGRGEIARWFRRANT